MSDDLRTRIAAVVREHQQGQEWGIPTDECECGWWSSRKNEIDYADHLADAVIRELTESIPPIVATAIQGFAQSELAAMSYHGASKDAFEVMEKMNREALQIAQYATKHEDWNA